MKSNEGSAGVSSRLAAHRLLMAVLKQRLTLDQAMEKLPSLSDSDRAFAYRLAKTCLRYKRIFDEVLQESYLEKSLKASRLDVSCCLVIGMAQILVLETPPHAAVNTTVELTKRIFPKMSGLVNAVCKKVASDKERIILSASKAPSAWLYQSWVDTYSEAVAQIIAQSHLQEPPLDVTWSQPIPQASLLPGGTQRLPKGVGFSELEGSGWAQDLAASLPVKLLGELSGLRVLDACAAPGGKTMQLASAGAQVTALDISKNRLKRLEENFERNNLSAEIVCADLRKWQPQEKFDLIVLDAPCSATGTIRRHPEIMHHRTQEDIQRLVSIQQDLLETALRWLTAEGRLLYITCSLQPEEGEAQMTPYKDRVIPLNASMAKIPENWITEEGYLRTTPEYLVEQGSMDGFFAALLRAD